MAHPETTHITEMQIPMTNDADRLRETRRVFWGFDLHGWEHWMIWSLGLVVIASGAVFIATASVVFLQREEAERSRETIAKLEQETAEANARTAQAQRDLEILRGQTSRRMPMGGKMVPLLKMSKGSVEILFGREDPDSAMVARIIGKILEDCGWTVLAVKPTPMEELTIDTLGQGWWSLRARSLGPNGGTAGLELAIGPERTDDRSPATILIEPARGI